MKLIEAVIGRPKLEEVRVALDAIGVEELMESDVITRTRRKEQVMTFRGARFVAHLVEKVKLEIIATDDAADRVIQAIGAIAGTGCKEDCRIAMRPYLEVV